MRTEFLRYIRQNRLLHPADTVLLAISGGKDSVCLLHLLLEIGVKPALAHVNFKLRGAESDGDADFVAELAATHQLTLHSTKLDAQAAASEEKTSVQMAARKLRYAFFKELQQAHGYTKIALAHHAADRTESLLLNISRGTGLPGLKGMPVKRQAYIRPLLFASPRQIIAYLNQNNISWREDSSNRTTKYKRNFVRQTIVPPLESLNPTLHEAVQMATEQAAAAERLVRYLLAANPTLTEEINGELRINLSALLKLPEPELLLYYVLRPYQFGWPQTKAILQTYQNVATVTGKKFSSARWSAFIDRHCLIIVPITNQPTYQPQVLARGETQAGPYIWQVRTLPASGYKISPDPRVAALDAGKLVPELVTRPWQEGDRFVPLGMKGTKKISDFMIDRKIPLNLKSEVWVVCSGTDVVWVAGHRPDDRYKITPATTTVLEIRQLPL